MGDLGKCLFCEQPFQQGDRGVVIGNAVSAPMRMTWVHTECVAIDILGPNWRERYQSTRDPEGG